MIVKKTAQELNELKILLQKMLLLPKSVSCVSLALLLN